MKIRNGFVSNSSSSSFVLISNSKPQNSKQFGKTFTRTSSRNSTVHNDYEYLTVTPYEHEINYCRGDIMWISSITDKIKYIMALYSRYYENDKNYFKKVLDATHKIFLLGISHWYCIIIPIVPLLAHYKLDNWETHKKTNKIETYVNVYTECTYIHKVVEMIEDEDTTLLDRFLFTDDSFCVLGGDEYSETFELQRKAVKFLNERRKEAPDFSYTLFADWTEHDADDIDYVDENGAEHKYGYSFHWEEDCFKDKFLYY